MALAASPAGAAVTAFVTNALEQTVSVVGVRTGAARATVAVGCDPRDVVAHPDGSRVYVANTCALDLDAQPGSVSVIDTSTHAVIDTIPVPFGPVALAIDARRRRLYAACLVEVPFSDEDSSGCSTWRISTREPWWTTCHSFWSRVTWSSHGRLPRLRDGVAGFRDDEGVVRLNFSGVVNVRLVHVGDGPTYRGAGGRLDVDRSGRTLYVTDPATDELAVVDTASAAEVARLPVGVAAQDVLFDRRGRRVFVTSAGDSPNALPDAVTAIKASTNGLTATFDGGWAPLGMAVVRNKGWLLVTNFYSGTLRVMSARTGELLRTIPVGLGADAVAIVR